MSNAINIVRNDAETKKAVIAKIQQLSSDELSAVASFINQFGPFEPINTLNDICMDGAKSPMSEEEVAEFVTKVRKERNAARN